MKTRSKTSLIASIFLLALIFCGCSHPKHRQLVGKWKMDATDEASRRVGRLDQGSGLMEDAARTLTEQMDDPIASMTIEFRSDNEMRTVTDFPMGGGEKSGTWRWISFDNKTNSAVIETVLNNDTNITTIHFVDDNTIKMVPPNLVALKFEMRFRRDE